MYRRTAGYVDRAQWRRERAANVPPSFLASGGNPVAIGSRLPIWLDKSADKSITEGWQGGVRSGLPNR